MAKYVNYQEALDGFTDIRKRINKTVEEGDKETFDKLWAELKTYAVHESSIAMDALAYYYKTGIPNMLPENYMRYISWELLACSRGNECAIEKMQFLLSNAISEVMESPEYDTIVYKNDIDGDDLYVIGKYMCKMLARKLLEIYPVDLVKMEDIYQPYTQEIYVNLNKVIEMSVPLTIEELK